MTFGDLFKVTIIQRQITWKWYNIELCYNGRPIRKSYMIYRTAPFSITLNHLYPRLQGHATVWRWISQRRHDIHSFNEILVGTYARLTEQCHFEDLEWLSKIFNDTKRCAVSLRQLSFLSHMDMTHCCQHRLCRIECCGMWTASFMDSGP